MKRRNFLQTVGVNALLLTGSQSIRSSSSAALIKAQNYRGIRLHRYASKGPIGHSTNSYCLETPDGLFLIDAQWVLSEARRSMQHFRSSTGKPILGVLITHAHTDHYGGLPGLLEGETAEIPIYASSLTRLSIKNDASGFRWNRSLQFGADFPQDIPIPNRQTEDRFTLDLGRISLDILERSCNEAIATTLVYCDTLNTLITGDMVYDRTFAIFREGMKGLENWKWQLQELRSHFDNSTLLPGHGNGRLGTEIIQAQIDFLNAFRDPVLLALDKLGYLPLGAKATIRKELLHKYGHYAPIVGLSRAQIIDQSLDWLSQALDQISD